MDGVETNEIEPPGQRNSEEDNFFNDDNFSSFEENNQK